ncbi:uncharacterized protein PFL1_00806 [Pseudozyma flocculosa PF-1]|uniref:Related to actin-interacting protein AIP3 n=1 Tax=Pseudozyma flocculosa TaxID=84751 RepID=A0A5C3F432_9BASI|nr:uncharacterized protein PFL1_00806 [Pseudozyma flocculosa PF-1]EPQ31471.1 hypothetical protein PFL1_00806 [Pseudozyma flocculosa PF-1]SPO38745.1 related to actin-interacting protein AIP3 [Pseudozyma flocculosa]
MFSNFVSRKTSGERQHRPESNSGSGSGSPASAYERIRHPHHIEAAGAVLPSSPPPAERQRDLGHPRGPRHDSSGSTSSIGMMHRSPAQLPEEMRAREREKQLERERERMREKERMSSRSSSASQQTPPEQPAPTRYSSNHMESSVTRLLVATKMLLESLTKWSLGERSEDQVSDIYVRLGNDFNSARVAFGSYGIDMSDLASVPDDLRACLERCLSEDASPAVLEVHLPRIREIIINLLQGLKMKQAEYKQFLVQQRAAAASRSDRDGATASASGSRRSRGGLSRSERVGASDGLPAPETAAAAAKQDALQRASSTGNQAPAANPPTSPREALGQTPLSPTLATSGRSSVQRPPSRTSRSFGESSSQAEARSLPLDGEAALQRASSHGGERTILRGSTDVAQPPGGGAKPVPAVPSDVARHSLVDPGQAPAGGAEQEEDEEQEEIIPAVESAEAKLTGGRLSQRSSGRGVRHATRPSVDSNADPADADPSMKALKNRDALERRASKRFSAYTFNKMGVGQGFGQSFNAGALNMAMFPPVNGALGSPLPERHGREQRASGSRRLQRPSMPDSTPSSGAASPAGTAKAGDYFSVQPPARSKARNPTSDKFEPIEEVKTPTSATSATGPDSLPTSQGQPRLRRPSDSRASARINNGLLSPGDSRKVMSQAISSTDSLPFVDAVGPPSDLDDQSGAPPGPTAEERVRLDAAQDGALTGRIDASAGSLNVYLQLGRQTRKATLELDPSNPLTRGITIARLRMLFIDRFAYSPGMDDFPSIYVKDPASGVSYELEDLGDVQEGCLLTLNIEPLDQVKQHLDLSLGAITRELRELKSAMTEREREARRVSHNFGNVGDSSFLAAANATPTKITDSQFQAAGHRVAQLKRANTRAANAAALVLGDDGVGPAGERSRRLSIDATSTTSSTPGSSVSGFKVAQELKAQYDELQALRREFAVMRQLQGDFDSDVKTIIGGIREQAAKVRQIASGDVAAERNFIVAGKTKLDSSSQEVLTLIEDLQDTVDDLKLDVIQRGVKPKPALVKQITSDIERATKGLLEVEKYVQTVKPSWKKTWETELQNIVDEQEFLNHQESLVADLRDDHDALQEVFANIQQVVKLRGSGRTGGKYIPPLPEEGHEGLSTVMLEVKSQAVNHEKRLRALQAAEKQRQKDLASRSDDFADELAGFVDGKALRKTGGHLEAERVRQKRDNATFKAMFGGGGSGGAPVAPVPGAGGGGTDKPKKFILGGGGGGGGGDKVKATAAASPPKAAEGGGAVGAMDAEAEAAVEVAAPSMKKSVSAASQAESVASQSGDGAASPTGAAATTETEQ